MKGEENKEERKTEKRKQRRGKQKNIFLKSTSQKLIIKNLI